MRKILVFGMTENPGGVESFLKNYYEHMNREVLQLDFLCNSYNPIAYEDEFQAMGATMFHFPPRHSHPIGFRRELKKFFAAHAAEYSAIWVNVNSLANVDYLKLAKRYGISRRIIHSHNAEHMDSGAVGKVRAVLHDLNRPKLARWATDFWACSEGAADFFYEGAVDASGASLRSKAVVIHNAIDVAALSCNEEARNRVRAKLGIPAGAKTLVIGNVGRLHFQKNQSFLLEIYACLRQERPDSLLVLVGQGEDEAMLRAKAADLGITDSVYFAGVQSNIADWFSAMDVYAMPSVFEGLPFVALEAQANGLPTLLSTGISPAAKLTGHCEYLPTEEGAAAWSAKLLAMADRGREQDTAAIREAFVKEGYEITAAAKELEGRLYA